jgi:hypothetical protein
VYVVPNWKNDDGASVAINSIIATKKRSAVVAINRHCRAFTEWGTKNFDVGVEDAMATDATWQA